MATFCRWHLFCFRSITLYGCFVCFIVNPWPFFLGSLCWCEWLSVEWVSEYVCDYEIRKRCEWMNQRYPIENYLYLCECDGRMNDNKISLVILPREMGKGGGLDGDRDSVSSNKLRRCHVCIWHVIDVISRHLETQATICSRHPSYLGSGHKRIAVGSGEKKMGERAREKKKKCDVILGTNQT